MIVNCPQCHAQSKIAPALLPGGVKVDCYSCGATWKELPSERSLSGASTPDVYARFDTPAQIDTEYLINATRQLNQNYVVNQKKFRQKTLAWTVLGFLSLMPIAAAVALPEKLVTSFPASITVFDQLDWPVNVYGLEIQHIEQQNRIVDGQHVLLIKGEIANISAEMQKIPALTFSLVDENGVEVQSWVHQQITRPVLSGEVTGFTTRIEAPASSAKNLKIRFAHRNEIGSNAEL